MSLAVETLDIPGPLLLTPERVEDSRGFIVTSYDDAAFAEAVGRDVAFRQDIDVYSAESGTLRGLHFQHPPFAQSRLVRVVRGVAIDVMVDIREGSPSFGQHVKVRLDDERGQMLWVPAGFAHGFVTRRRGTQVGMKVESVYAQHAEGRIVWNDPLLHIDWEVAEPIVSDNDRHAPGFADLVSPFALRMG